MLPSCLVAGHGHAGAGVDLGKLLGALDAILRARRGDVGGGDAQVAIVGQRLRDQRLQPRIAEDVADSVTAGSAASRLRR